MTDKQKRIIVGITGASGMPYAIRLLEVLAQKKHTIYLVMSKAAQVTMALECTQHGVNTPEQLKSWLDSQYNLDPEQIALVGQQKWTSAIASGSNIPDQMVVVPCSMGCLAAIAHGMSDNVLERAADVMLKEQKKLILVPRETPLSPIHLENMLKLSRLGVSIIPASPGFYHKPTQINELVDFVVARVLNQLNIEHNLVPNWGED